LGLRRDEDVPMILGGFMRDIEDVCVYFFGEHGDVLRGSGVCDAYEEGVSGRDICEGFSCFEDG
jgi:hypothetical protein